MLYFQRECSVSFAGVMHMRQLGRAIRAKAAQIETFPMPGINVDLGPAFGTIRAHQEDSN